MVEEAAARRAAPASVVGERPPPLL